MKNNIRFNHYGLTIFCFAAFIFLALAVSPAQEGSVSNQNPAKEEPVSAVEEAPQDEQTITIENSANAGNVTLDFKEADIRNVLKIISLKSGVNIVTTPDVIGNVTIRLVDVPWEKALDVILKTYGFAHERQGNIITVAPLDKLTSLKKQEVELAQVQPTYTEVFNMQFLDALDAKKALEPLLSPRGKITVLEMTGQRGWEFGQTQKGEQESMSRKREEGEVTGRSKILIISDIPPVLEKVREVVGQIDIKPKQVLIETRIMEVSRDKLRDIGVDWGTGAGGAESTVVSMTPIRKSRGVDLMQLGGHALGGYGVTPAIFGPKESTMTTANSGLNLIFKKLAGTQFEMVLHALEEDVDTNTLSAPRIMALNNQEASILIGTKYPILKTDNTGAGSTAVVTVTLDYYQDIGIQLNVVPQIGTNDYINMVIHPAVSEITTTDSSITSAKYPIVDIREAETRILMKDGETVVIGGLLKDVKKKEEIGIPYLSKIPILGKIFTRETVDTQKIDMLIFITARIVRDDYFTSEEIAKLEERFNRGPNAEKENKKKDKKK